MALAILDKVSKLTKLVVDGDEWKDLVEEYFGMSLRSVPQVWIDDVYIGGNDDLQKHLAETSA